jgi:hypothetical protein
MPQASRAVGFTLSIVPSRSVFSAARMWAIVDEWSMLPIE